MKNLAVLLLAAAFALPVLAQEQEKEIQAKPVQAKEASPISHSKSEKLLVDKSARKKSMLLKQEKEEKGEGKEMKEKKADCKESKECDKDKQ
jgi:hypothetical protein